MLQINSLSDDLESPQRDSFGLSQKSSQQSAQAHEKVITRMASGVRDQNRVNIYINDKFFCSLDVNQVVDLGVKVGKVLAETELQDLHSASEFGKLYQRALEWALMRPHSVWETRDYLKRRQIKRAQLNRKRAHDDLKPLPEIQDATIELVVERLTSRGYVDDYKFAEYYIENRFVKKGVSRRRLEMELHKKQVPNNIIQEVLSSSVRNENDELAKMIAKKRKKYDTPKLIQYLVRQGFGYDAVKAAIEKFDADCGEVE